jgi:hypothetical protein
MMREGLQTISKSSSPMLRNFEVNPFRILRLPINATTNGAALQAEQIATLARAEIAPTEPDPLPWLPPTSIYEVQQAAQTVEEPFLRLTEQLFWFDIIHDTSATNIQAVLLKLEQEMLQKYISEKIELPATIDPESPEETSIAVMANAINQANLRLLLASSLLNGILVRQTNDTAQLKEIDKKDWKSLGDISIFPEVHSIIGIVGDDSTTLNAGHHWKEALKRWNQILNHPWFNLYIKRCIDDLKDDFVSDEDIETIEESIRNRLADLATEETKFLLFDGRYSLATEIISALSNSGFDKRTLAPSLRPIYHLFKAEISELESLLDASEQNNLGHLQAYFKRLEVIKNRWKAIDDSGLIGLNQILDDAVEQLYLRLRNQAEPSAELEPLLSKAIEISSAKSLRERMTSFQKELEDAKNRLCYFCREAPDYEKSVVLKGKKETGRTTSGNTTTIHYNIRYAIILRCDRCAQLHDFVRTAGILTGVSIIPGLSALLFLAGLGKAIFLLGAAFSCPWLAIVIAVAIGAAIIELIKWALHSISRLLARSITPSEHKLFGDYRDTESYYSLTAESYSVTPDWRRNAVSFAEKNN